MMKHILISAAAALALSLGTLGASTEPASAQHWGGHGGGEMWPRGWHGGGGGWHGGGGWNGGGWHGGGGGWHGGGGCWNCGWNNGWNNGWAWGVAPAFGLGLGLGYGAGAWDNGSTRVCQPVFRAVRVHTPNGWHWRRVFVGNRCYWTDYGGW